MSSGNELPWSSKPKNGIKTFFSEETFSKWIGQDSHGTRMEERLRSRGIDMSWKFNDPFFVPKEDTTDHATNAECDVGANGEVVLKAVFSEIEENLEPQLKLEVKENTLNQNFQSSNTEQETSLNTLKSEVKSEEHLQQFDKSKPDKSFNKEPMSLLPEDIYTCHGGDSSKSFNSQDIGFGSCNIGASSQSNLSKEKNTEIEKGKDEISSENIVNSENSIEAEIDGESLSTSIGDTENIGNVAVRPFSFYKEATEEEKEQPEAEIEDNSKIVVENTTVYTTEFGKSESLYETDYKTNVQMQVRKTDSQGIDCRTLEFGQEDAERSLEEDKKAKKQLMMQDKMFFNIKDRIAEKYFPEIFKKRPRNRRSKMTCQQHKLYLDLARCFGNVDFKNPLQVEDKNFKKYLEMKRKVTKEQELYQNYLRSISYPCRNDYEYIHPEVEKYATARYLMKKRECFKYPRYYSKLKKFILTDTGDGSPQMMQYIRPLCELGTVSKLVLPSVLPGMPQPCLTTIFKKINEISPVIQTVYRGTYVWNKVVCSQDSNAEQLAVPNKCDFVMSSSTIRCLVDNQGKTFKYWDMPFTVREYKLDEGEKTTIHKVIYIDKAFIRQSQFIPKDQTKLYQKHAIRACAIKQNVRGHVLCGIKPVNEPVRVQTLEEIEHDMNEYEGKVKETVKNLTLQYESDDECKKSKGKKGKKRKHGQVGVFDLEKDIDDLETFGMDTGLAMKGVEELDKGTAGSKVKTPEKTDAVGSVIKKGRKSEKDELESLKSELESIKTLAIKERSKQVEVVKDENSSKETEIKVDGDGSQGKGENTEFESCTIEGGAGNNMLEKSETVVNTSRDHMRQGQKGILNMKTVSDLSEKMKQMSTIKAKLSQKMKDQGVNSEEKCKEPPRITQLKNNQINLVADKPNTDISDVGKQVNSNNQDKIVAFKTKAEEKLVDTASDSDSESGGLVIDAIVSPIIPSRKKKKAVEDMGGSTADIPKLDMVMDANLATMELKGSDTLEMKESEAPTLEIMKESCKTVEEEKKGKKEDSDSEAVEESQGPSRKVITRSCKRKSTSEVVEDISIPKRTLRSSARNKKIQEQVKGTAELTVAGKDDSVSEKQEPKKRGRGRARKSVSLTEENMDCKESKAEKIETKVDNNGKTENPGNDKLESEESKDEDDNSDDDLKEEESPVRKRSNVRRIDSEDEAEETSGKSEKCVANSGPGTRRKELKKDVSDIEAKKIREMAEAMKKKVEETKTNIRKNKVLKKKECKDSGKVSNTVITLDRMDISYTDTIETKITENKEISPKEWKPSFDNTLQPGLEGILKTQDKPLSLNKGSLAEVFTQKHGMSHCGFPVEGNVTYHQWNLDGLNILTRSKYHGYVTGQGLVHISPKVEYQPNFGYEQDTVSETCKNWISVYIRPNSSLLKPRINPFNSEIMMIEHVEYKDLVPVDSLFKPGQAFSDLHFILNKLKSLPVGQYLLKNNPKKEEFSILKAEDQVERQCFDLHQQHSSFTKTAPPPHVQWTPIDTNLTLPHQRKQNYIPATFPPIDAQLVEKKQHHNVQEKKKKKKKNKKK